MTKALLRSLTCQTRLVGGLLAGLTMALTAGSAQAAWREVPVADGAICARGTPFSFFVSDGDPAKIAVNFAGGGACSDAVTCGTETPTFTDSVDDVRQALQAGYLGGFFADGRSKNPLVGWTQVLIPYCTGDLHWGSTDTVYTKADGTEFTIHHRGADNATAVLNWLKQSYPVPDRLFITGCSAGAYGSVYWTPRLSQLYPQVPIKQFGDSGAGVKVPTAEGPVVPAWNITKYAPAWIPGLDPAVVDFPNLSLNDLYLREANYYPKIPFTQFNHSYDKVQTFFFAGSDAPEMQLAFNQGLTATIRQFNSGAQNVHSYTGGGDEHCVTTGPELFTMTTQGTALIDWLKTYLNGGPLQNVQCQGAECGSVGTTR